MDTGAFISTIDLILGNTDRAIRFLRHNRFAVNTGSNPVFN